MCMTAVDRLYLVRETGGYFLRKKNLAMQHTATNGRMYIPHVRTSVYQSQPSAAYNATCRV